MGVPGRGGGRGSSWKAKKREEGKELEVEVNGRHEAGSGRYAISSTK